VCRTRSRPRLEDCCKVSNTNQQDVQSLDSNTTCTPACTMHPSHKYLDTFKSRPVTRDKVLLVVTFGGLLEAPKAAPRIEPAKRPTSLLRPQNVPLYDHLHSSDTHTTKTKSFNCQTSHAHTPFRSCQVSHTNLNAKRAYFLLISYRRNTKSSSPSLPPSRLTKSKPANTHSQPTFFARPTHSIAAMRSKLLISSEPASLFLT